MCSQRIAAPSHSWSPGSLCTRTGWSFDSNRKTQTNHPIPRMIGRSQDGSRIAAPRAAARFTAVEADADHVKLKTEMLQLRLMEKKREFLPPIKKRLIWA